jgi:hypothetical protein
MGISQSVRRVAYWVVASIAIVLTYGATAPQAQADSTCGSCPAGFTAVSDGTCFNINNSQTISCPGNQTQKPQTATQKKIRAAKGQSMGFEPGGVLYPPNPHTSDLGPSEDTHNWAWYFGLPTEGPDTGSNRGGGSTSGHLGMYISPTGGAIDGQLSGFGAAVHSNGYSLSDSAGALAPGTKAPGFNESVGGGTIGGYYDASWLVPYGQGLLFKGFFNYSGANLTLGSLAGGGGSAGNARAPTHLAARFSTREGRLT